MTVFHGVDYFAIPEDAGLVDYNNGLKILRIGASIARIGHPVPLPDLPRTITEYDHVFEALIPI